MRTHVPPLAMRRAVNPILSDREIIDLPDGETGAFLTLSARRLDRHMPLISALTAGGFLLLGYIAHKLGAPASLVHLFTLVSFVLGLTPGLRSAWESLLELRVDIDVLMILGAVLAAYIGEPADGALLLFLFALSGALEEEATRRTQSAIRSLRDLNPTEAIVLADTGEQRRQNARDVPVNARVLVRPGDRVPLDGIVVDGESAVDEAPITGESVPRDKGLGDSVFAGTINTTGRLVIEVTRVAGETQLSKIIRLVTEARAQQSKVERLFDRVSSKYALAVIASAFAFGAGAPLLSHMPWREALSRAIALLIVASPCALIIATPIAYLSAIASAARRGVLIKGGVFLEALARCRTMIFDKTGTLTVGRPRVARIVPVIDLTEHEALRIAGALEASSSHPLATAVGAALAERHIEPYRADEMESVPGRGIRGHINGAKVAVGQIDFVAGLLGPRQHQYLRAAADELSSAGNTISGVAIANGQPEGGAAVLAFADPLRPDAEATIAGLRADGVRRMLMFTGDHAQVAEGIARRLGLDEFHAEMMPEDKVARTAALSDSAGPVAVVGDGVNDAPALARANVGIAMASIGSDAALEAAPIVLMGNSLAQLGWLHRHARRTARIVRQNLTLALAVIVVLSGFAMAGQVKLPVAVMAHEGSTLLVALNALRLLRA